jgi:Flp pilus assembly protein TadB
LTKFAKGTNKRGTVSGSPLFLFIVFLPALLLYRIGTKKNGESLRAASAKKSHRLPAVSLSSQSQYISPFFLFLKKKKNKIASTSLYIFLGVLFSALCCSSFNHFTFPLRSIIVALIVAVVLFCCFLGCCGARFLSR